MSSFLSLHRFVLYIDFYMKRFDLFLHSPAAMLYDFAVDDGAAAGDRGQGSKDSTAGVPVSAGLGRMSDGGTWRPPPVAEESGGGADRFRPRRVAHRNQYG